MTRGVRTRNALHIFGKVRTIRLMGTVHQIHAGHSRSRVETLDDSLAERIERGLLRPGERLASIRTASDLFGVSKNTIVEAYERLVASGEIESRPRARFFFSLHPAKRA